MINPHTETNVIAVGRPDDQATVADPQSPATEATTRALTAASDQPTGGGGVPTATLVMWAAGCTLLLVAAVTLPHLSEWADRHGSIPIFLGFFLVMSLAGRWFWAGTDAIISAIRGRA